jgi:hypothetical protein
MQNQIKYEEKRGEEDNLSAQHLTFSAAETCPFFSFFSYSYIHTYIHMNIYMLAFSARGKERKKKTGQTRKNPPDTYTHIEREREGGRAKAKPEKKRKDHPASNQLKKTPPYASRRTPRHRDAESDRIESSRV